MNGSGLAHRYECMAANSNHEALRVDLAVFSLSGSAPYRLAKRKWMFAVGPAQFDKTGQSKQGGEFPERSDTIDQTRIKGTKATRCTRFNFDKTANFA